MKHLFITLSIIILCSFSAVFAQNKDLIVNIQGDSMKCTIIEIDFGEIYYRSGGEDSEIEFIFRNQVKSYQLDFYAQPVNNANTTPAKPTDTPLTGYLTADGRTVYLQNKELSVEEVRRLMYNTNSLQIYNSGISKNKTGNTLIIFGTGICLGGIIITALQPFESQYIYNENGKEYFGYRNETLNYGAGLGLAAAGGAMIITGAIKKSNSGKLIKRAIDSYNNNKTKTSVKWDFDFFGNGARLAIKF